MIYFKPFYVKYLDEIFVDVIDDLCWNVGFESEVVVQLQKAVYVLLTQVLGQCWTNLYN
jgi:hypothetical protein